MNGFNFSTFVKPSQNYTPFELIHSYAKQHPGVKVGCTCYGKTYLIIAGIQYFYDHCKTVAVSPSSEMVTVYLTDKL